MERASLKIKSKYRQAGVTSKLYGRIYAMLLALIVGMVVFPITTFADNGNTIVHVTKSGVCYHTENCSYLKSDIPMTLYEAVVEKGYNPCSRCNPPQYDGPEPLHEKMEKSQGGSTNKSVKKASTTSTTSTTKTTVVTKTVEEEKYTTAEIVVLIIFYGIGGWTAITFVLGAYSDIKEARKKKKVEKEFFEQEKKKYMELYANRQPITLVDIPDGAFVKDGLPCTNNMLKGIYGDYTVYVAPHQPRVLHVKASCGKNLRPINYYNVCKLPHCKKCATGHKLNLPKIDWYEDYLRIDKIKKKYNIP